MVNTQVPMNGVACWGVTAAPCPRAVDTANMNSSAAMGTRWFSIA